MVGGENRAGVLVSAGSDDAEGSRGEQFFAKRAEVAADGVGAGLDPEHGFGAGDEGEEGSEGVGGEFVQDVADEEEADGAGRAEGGERRAQSRRSNGDAEGREGGLGGAGRVIAGEAGVVPDGERIEVLGTEKGNDAACGDTTAAAPIEDGAGGCSRLPIPEAEFAEDMVPFPADAFAVGEVVAGEVGGSLPIDAGGGTGGAAEKFLAEAVERRPVEFGPSHERAAKRHKMTQERKAAFSEGGLSELSVAAEGGAAWRGRRAVESGVRQTGARCACHPGQPMTGRSAH